MRDRCPKCDNYHTQYRVYRRENRGGERSWIPVGWICDGCGHLYAEIPDDGRHFHRPYTGEV